MSEINIKQDIPIYSSEELNILEDDTKFIAWLQKYHGYNHHVYGNYYKQAVRSLRENLASSDYWKGLGELLQNINIEYKERYHCNLLETTNLPTIYVKTIGSVIDKAYRKDYIQNEKWPEEPIDGWVLPNNWFVKLNDILRTTIVVKYLDGVSFLLDHLKQYAEKNGCDFTYDYEARENGYYAAHTGTRIMLAMPRISDWEDEIIPVNLEIQITTQLQTLIKDLLHSYYEQDRLKVSDENVLWQWDYTNDRFNTNYMGHIVHYVEGMVVSLRNKQMNKNK